MKKTIVIDKTPEELDKLLAKIDKVLANAPEGNVSVHSGKGKKKCYFTLICGSRSDQTRVEKYIPQKAAAKVKVFLQKKYCEELRKVIKKERDALVSFLSRYKPFDKYKVLGNNTEEIEKRIDLLCKKPEDLYKEWEQEDYPGNPYPFDDGVEFYTKRGERVRSKAEIIAGNILFELGIPYRYENRLEIDGDAYYPDFTTIRTCDGKFFYIEFFGMMDDPKYAEKALRKMNVYNKSKYAGQFIYIFESQKVPMNVAAITNLLKRYLL